MVNCTNCGKDGESQASFTVGGFIVTCGVDGHETIAIIDNIATVKQLMRDCPLGHEIIESEFPKRTYDEEEDYE